MQKVWNSNCHLNHQKRLAVSLQVEGGPRAAGAAGAAWWYGRPARPPVCVTPTLCSCRICSQCLEQTECPAGSSVFSGQSVPAAQRRPLRQLCEPLVHDVSQGISPHFFPAWRGGGGLGWRVGAAGEASARLCLAWCPPAGLSAQGAPQHPPNHGAGDPGETNHVHANGQD